MNIIFSDRMRLFIAVKISDDVKNNIREVYKFLSSNGIKKVSLDNLHYTLQFLGEVPKENVQEVIKVFKTEPYIPLRRLRMLLGLI